MSRIKLFIPDKLPFVTQITVRISDLNYGNHLSNDVYLSYMHEARMQFFAYYGYTEMNLAGVSVIMGDTAIVYKQECFYGDMLNIEVGAADFGPRSFDLYYRFIKKNTNAIACEAKTGMVCFNYETRQTEAVPAAFRSHFD